MYFLPFIAAFIGWFTNFLAIKMLFYPRQPVRFMGLTIQGVFPKRKDKFALQIGEVFGQEIINSNLFKDALSSPQNMEKILPYISHFVQEFIDKKLSEVFPILSAFISNKTIHELKTAFLNEIVKNFPQIIDKYFSSLKDELDSVKIITAKIQSFPNETFEKMMNKIMKEEFKFIEIIGGILGFIIGLIQILLLKLPLNLF